MVSVGNYALSKVLEKVLEYMAKSKRQSKYTYLVAFDIKKFF